MENEQLDLLIIGAGPAGLSAADAAAREGLSYLVIEKGTIADTFEDNPYTSLRIMTQADLLNKAKAVGMDSGPAKNGAKEGGK